MPTSPLHPAGLHLHHRRQRLLLAARQKSHLHLALPRLRRTPLGRPQDGSRLLRRARDSLHCRAASALPAARRVRPKHTAEQAAAAQPSASRALRRTRESRVRLRRRLRRLRLLPVPPLLARAAAITRRAWRAFLLAKAESAGRRGGGQHVGYRDREVRGQRAEGPEAGHVRCGLRVQDARHGEEGAAVAEGEAGGGGEYLD